MEPKPRAFHFAFHLHHPVHLLHSFISFQPKHFCSTSFMCFTPSSPSPPRTSLALPSHASFVHLLHPQHFSSTLFTCFIPSSPSPRALPKIVALPSPAYFFISFTSLHVRSDLLHLFHSFISSTPNTQAATAQPPRDTKTPFSYPNVFGSRWGSNALV